MDSGRPVCSRSGNATFSNTLRSVSRAPFWNSMPMRWRRRYSSPRRSSGTSCPSTRMLPSCGSSWPPIRRNSVVLPVAAGAHDRGHLAARDIQVHAVEDHAVAARETQSADAHQRIGLGVSGGLGHFLFVIGWFQRTNPDIIRIVAGWDTRIGDPAVNGPRSSPPRSARSGNRSPGVRA